MSPFESAGVGPHTGGKASPETGGRKRRGRSSVGPSYTAEGALPALAFDQLEERQLHTGPERSVSLAVTFRTQKSDRWSDAYRFNEQLRKRLGVSAGRVGSKPTLDATKALAVRAAKRLRGQLSRRRPLRRSSTVGARAPSEALVGVATGVPHSCDAVACWHPRVRERGAPCSSRRSWVIIWTRRSGRSRCLSSVRLSSMSNRRSSRPQGFRSSSWSAESMGPARARPSTASWSGWTRGTSRPGRSRLRRATRSANGRTCGGSGGPCRPRETSASSWATGTASPSSIGPMDGYRRPSSSRRWSGSAGSSSSSPTTESFW